MEREHWGRWSPCFYKFHLVDEGYGIVFDGRKISYEELLAIKKRYEEENWRLIVRLDRKRRTYFIWDYESYPVKYKNYMSVLLTAEEKIWNDWHIPTIEELNEIVWARDSYGYKKMQQFRALGTLLAIFSIGMILYSGSENAVRMFLASLLLAGLGELGFYRIGFFIRKVYVRKDIVCKTCTFYREDNMLFSKEGNVTAFDMNGEIVRGRIRAKMFGENTMSPENYMIAYKETGKEKIFFSQVKRKKDEKTDHE